MSAVATSPIRVSAVALDRYAIWIVLVLLLVAAGLVSDAFFKVNYLANLLRQAPPVGITALGVTFVMLMRGVDLSVGAIISMTVVISALNTGVRWSGFPTTTRMSLTTWPCSRASRW